jgi:hypothetical protein
MTANNMGRKPCMRKFSMATSAGMGNVASPGTAHNEIQHERVQMDTFRFEDIFPAYLTNRNARWRAATYG